MRIPHPLLHEEIACWRAGLRRVAGVDEAGRGPLAGPVVAAAVVLDPSEAAGWWAELHDSKLLAASVRERLAAVIRREADVGLGVASVETIDAYGIIAATRQAATQALAALSSSPDFIIFDGRDISCPGIAYRCVVGGDRRCLSVAAASIVAKVERDRLMREYHVLYPRYGFDRHKGYASAEHLRLLRELGPCPIHRQRYAPVREALASTIGSHREGGA